jgi:glycolate oxidase
MGGTLSGEHGIGTSKAEYLPLEQSPELIALQLRLKAAFDPRGLLNPHKIFPRRGHGPC